MVRLLPVVCIERGAPRLPCRDGSFFRGRRPGAGSGREPWPCAGAVCCWI